MHVQNPGRCRSQTCLHERSLTMERTISPEQLQSEFADKLILDVRRSSLR